VTTIVAVQGPSWAVVGFDSQVTEEGGRSYTLGRGSSKVVKNGPYLLGAAGDVRAINILAYAFTPPKPGPITGIRLDRFVTSKFVPALRECFEDHGYAAKETKEQAQHGSTVLVIINGSIYEIGEDYAWVRDTTGIYSFGSGGDYALGAMYASAGERISDMNSLDTQRLIRDSLHIAARLDPGSGPPFHIMQQAAPQPTTNQPAPKRATKAK
jgi:ATP-dependent protease HslVU (ClpYQ) peptidase subunit